MNELIILFAGLVSIGVAVFGGPKSQGSIDTTKIPKTTPQKKPTFKEDPDNTQISHTGDPVSPTDKNPSRAASEPAKPSTYKYPDVPFTNPNDVRKEAERPIPVISKPTDVKSILSEGESRREDLRYHAILAEALNTQQFLENQYYRERTDEWLRRLNDQKKIVAERQRLLDEFMAKKYGKPAKKDPIVPPTPPPKMCLENDTRKKAPAITWNEDPEPAVRYVPCPSPTPASTSPTLQDPAIQSVLNPLAAVFSSFFGDPNKKN